MLSEWVKDALVFSKTCSKHDDGVHHPPYLKLLYTEIIGEKCGCVVVGGNRERKGGRQMMRLRGGMTDGGVSK